MTIGSLIRRRRLVFTNVLAFVIAALSCVTFCSFAVAQNAAETAFPDRPIRLIDAVSAIYPIGSDQLTSERRGIIRLKRHSSGQLLLKAKEDAIDVRSANCRLIHC